MKIIINNTGEVKEVDQREATRLINRGTAHYTKVEPPVVAKPKKLVDIPDEVFEVPKKRSRKKKSKFGKWND